MQFLNNQKIQNILSNNTLKQLKSFNVGLVNWADPFERLMVIFLFYCNNSEMSRLQ